jgi:hypothetical protein
MVVELLMAKRHASPQRVSDAQRPRVGTTNHELLSMGLVQLVQ